jgi:hypothetical protein
MIPWLKALIAETPFAVWTLISTASTLTTFYFPRLAGAPRVVSILSAILGFAWANFKVFQKQEKRIAELGQAIALNEVRTSALLIRQANGSRYIVHPVGSSPLGDFNGIFLEFRLMIENTGRRNSNVNDYQVEIAELQETFDNLRPEEGRNGIQGRHCQHGMNPASILSKTGIITVQSESVTNYGSLLFFITGVNLGRFAKAGLQMTGESRIFPSLHCKLTLRDTIGSAATQEFELPEA